jgi:hypothetical protein
MMTKPTKRVRCAVYTRVSTEYGLDQEFKSLDAQREAAEAFLRGRHAAAGSGRQAPRRGGSGATELIR